MKDGKIPMSYEPVIGLEVHAQLKTRSKIFCGCSTRFGAEPNTQVCPVCLGLPGALPVLNRQAVLFTIEIGLATDCTVRRRSLFARKNYFYPDCPKNYQISQYDLPLCQNGMLRFRMDGNERSVGITRIHLEEDAGKLIHEERGRSLVDFNRTGVPLIEIVSEPDLRSPQEARAYLERLKQTLLYLDICDGNMEEGSLRCDANVSVRPFGSRELGTKTEIKNLNSFKGVEQALTFEIRRQRAALEEGTAIEQETRLWDAQKGEARVMRSKEEAHDYRYFPEPDLRPLVIPEEWVEEARRDLPELPEVKEARFQRDYALPAYDAGVLTADAGVADYYERVAKASPDSKKASNWVMGELMRELKERKISIEDFNVLPEDLGGLIHKVEDRVISGSMAKEVFGEMMKSGKSPDSIIEEKGLGMISDAETLRPLCERAVADHPKEVEKFRAGRKQVFGFFVGRVMAETRGKADPELVSRILREILG